MTDPRDFREGSREAADNAPAASRQGEPGKEKGGEGEGPWEEADDPIADLIYEIVSRMGMDPEIEWEEREDHVRYFIEVDQAGQLIGRHGSVLEALQYLVGVINARKRLTSRRMILDVEGYRERREKSLRDTARRAAREVLRTRKRLILKPMLPGDRRIVHLALSRHPKIVTWSEGEGEDRCVVISPREGER